MAHVNTEESFVLRLLGLSHGPGSFPYLYISNRVDRERRPTLRNLSPSCDRDTCRMDLCLCKVDFDCQRTLGHRLRVLLLGGFFKSGVLYRYLTFSRRDTSNFEILQKIFIKFSNLLKDFDKICKSSKRFLEDLQIL